MSQQKPKDTLLSKYGYLWATLALFLLSLLGEHPKPATDGHLKTGHHTA
jgi:hypothetical protein